MLKNHLHTNELAHCMNSRSQYAFEKRVQANCIKPTIASCGSWFVFGSTLYQRVECTHTRNMHTCVGGFQHGPRTKPTDNRTDGRTRKIGRSARLMFDLWRYIFISINIFDAACADVVASSRSLAFWRMHNAIIIKGATRAEKKMELHVGGMMIRTL